MRGRTASLACLMCFALLLPSAPSPLADQFDEADAYFERGEKERGIELLNSIAEKGDPATQYKVGEILIGFGDIGARWIESAAERRFAPAQADMGLMYATGYIHVEQDLARSFMWYFLSLQGDLDASRRDHATRSLKEVYAAMTPRERKRAEQLILNWKPKE